MASIGISYSERNKRTFLSDTTIVSIIYLGVLHPLKNSSSNYPVDFTKNRIQL